MSIASRFFWIAVLTGLVLLPFESLGAMRTVPIEEGDSDGFEVITSDGRAESRDYDYDECWVKIYSDRNYKGQSIYIRGEHEIANLKEWAGGVGSVLTGPRATLKLFGESNFRDLDYLLKPSVARKSLAGFPQGDDIESLVVECD